MAEDGVMERLAELIRVKNAADAEIAAHIGRPCHIGHAGEWIAAEVFGIALHPSAVHLGSDGVFTEGALAGRSVNVKWYGRLEGILDVHSGTGSPDAYLVLSGPRSAAASSRGGVRPWTIATVHLFDHVALVDELTRRGVGIGTASSLRRADWDAAEVHPGARSPLLTLTPEQHDALRLFAPEFAT